MEDKAPGQGENSRVAMWKFEGQGRLRGAGAFVGTWTGPWTRQTQVRQTQARRIHRKPLSSKDCTRVLNLRLSAPSAC